MPGESSCAARRPDLEHKEFHDGSHRGIRLRRDPHAAGEGQVQRLAARHQAGRPRRRPDRRDARSATPASIPRASTTSCWAVVSPVGDQGADIAKTAALAAGLPDTVAGVQLNRFCASGLEAVNIAAQKVALRLGGPGPRRRRRVDVARADGLRRRRLGDGPGDELRHRLRAAGHRRRPDRHDRGLQPRRTSTRTPRARRSGPPKAQAEGRFARSVVPVATATAGRPRPRRVHPAGTTVETLGEPQAVLRRDGRDGRLRRRRAAEVPLGRADRPRAHAGQLVRHRRRRLARRDRQRGRRARRSA